MPEPIFLGEEKGRRIKRERQALSANGHFACEEALRAARARIDEKLREKKEESFAMKELGEGSPRRVLPVVPIAAPPFSQLPDSPPALLSLPSCLFPSHPSSLRKENAFLPRRAQKREDGEEQNREWAYLLRLLLLLLLLRETARHRRCLDSAATMPHTRRGAG